MLVCRQEAKLTDRKPSESAICTVVFSKQGAAGKACFSKYGDGFWVKDYLPDGHHIEMRGSTSPNGRGWRCYSHYGSKAGWAKCQHGDWAAFIREDQNLYALAVVMEGRKILNTSPHPITSATGG